ncbi:hypothetical protein [Noviherbaspirillum saxi]|uniref:Uncharacterized protein n=1 Tax=Noviherbaspirillum saxi TaxID=2320863 RepID=A0A3A3FHN3_9BURK|nr:hypothetical protein [Noviherbaspirillum saxi]RJF95013.1 hypothetical protein D3871_16200 [Noviherbaspirillum saxi]
MRIPKKGTSGRIVIDAIYKHGPMTIEQGLRVHRILATYLSRTREVYKRAVKSGWLTEENGVYSLSASMTEHLNSCSTLERETSSLVLTPPATPREFKPLALWRLPDPRGWRRDAESAREPHFFNGSVMDAPFRGSALASSRLNGGFNFSADEA